LVFVWWSSARRKGVVAVEQWAELRRLHFVAGVSIRELQRRTGLGRNTIRRALRSDGPPAYVRRVGASKLDGFREEIQRLLGEDPRLPGIRIFELIAELGFDGGKTLVYDYVAELRPLYAPPPRAFQRTRYRRGEILQFDLWQPAREIPSASGRRGAPGSSSPLLARGCRDVDLLQAGQRHPRWALALHHSAGWVAGDGGDRSRGRVARRAAGIRRTRSPRSAVSCR
jgi:hypothetical protein